MPDNKKGADKGPVFLFRRKKEGPMAEGIAVRAEYCLQIYFCRTGMSGFFRGKKTSDNTLAPKNNQKEQHHNFRGIIKKELYFIFCATVCMTRFLNR